MVVVNSSPIISLGKIGRLDLLHKVFGKIIIAKQVYEEIISKPYEEEAIALKKAVEDEWIKVQSSEEIKSNLGTGESASIYLASKIRQILIADDKKAVFVADTFGIECHGTLYVVMLALNKKVIKNKEEAIEILNSLIENKLYLSSDVLSEFYGLLGKIN